MYLLQFTDLEFISTERVYQEYQEQQELEKYGESFTDDFEEDLEELDYLDDSDMTVSDYLFDTLFVFFDTIKLPFIAFFIILGFELFFEIPGIRFSQILKATILAEFVFVLQSLIHQLILLVFYPGASMVTIIYTEPLSLKSVLGPGFEIGNIFEYFINYLDGFELLYLLFLPYLISRMYDLKYTYAFTYVGIFYIASQLLLISLEYFLFEIIL